MSRKTGTKRITESIPGVAEARDILARGASITRVSVNRRGVDGPSAGAASLESGVSKDQNGSDLAFQSVAETNLCGKVRQDGETIIQGVGLRCTTKAPLE